GLRQVPDLLEDVENEMASVRGLAQFAVHAAADVEVMNVSDGVGRGDPGTDRRMRVERLAKDPLRRAVLPQTLGHVIADAVADDVFGRTLRRNMPPALADHRHEFDLVIDKGRDLGDLHRRIGTIDGGDGLGEPDLVLGRAEFALSDVVGVIETDSEDLARAKYRCEQLNTFQRKAVALGDSLLKPRSSARP